MESSSQWTRIGFKQIKKRVEDAVEENKYVILKDEMGNVPTYFQYSGSLLEFHKLKM